ncbi:MAG: alpha/beta fold hydrolase [Candidatus Nanopelagicales bacterium]
MAEGDREADYWFRSASTGRFRRGAPRSPQLVSEGERLLFVRSADGRSASGDLWHLDTDTGDERLVVAARDLLGGPDEASLPAQERARRERARESGGGITEFSTTPSGDRVAFALGGRLFGGGTGAGERITELAVPGPVVDPRISPDGTAIAWHAGGRMYLAAADGSGPIALTPDDGASWGLADFIAAEELGRSRGFWWAPDGGALLVARVDDADVAEWWLSDPAHPRRRPRRHRYPAAGTVNASVELWRATVDGAGLQRVLAVGPGHEHEYLATVSWRAAGALASTLSRDQRQCAVWSLAPDAAEVARWTDDAWVDVVQGAPSLLPDGRLLTVRRDVDADHLRVFVGEHPVSPADLGIRSVLGVDADRVLVRAAPEPSQSMVFALPLGADGPAPGPASQAPRAEDLSGPGWFAGAQGQQALVLTGASATERAPEMVVHRRSGAGPARQWRVASRAEDPGVHPEPEFHTVGGVRYAILWPRNCAREGLPILMAPYGGPHSQRVMGTPAAFLDDQVRADQGYAVVVADGRGSPGGSAAWERAIRGDLLGPPLADQVAALDDVVARFGTAVDPSRVGIIGWSFGGYLSAHAVLARPDRFTVAVAGAPVSEWRLYDTAYSERYLGDPRTNPSTYDANSLLPLAAGLDRPLMLIHGLADDNVVVAHTLHLSSALLAAGRPHTVLPLTGITHITPQPVVAANLALLQNAFLAEHLRPGAALTR